MDKDECKDWTEDPKDGAEGQACLEPDELAGRVGRIHGLAAELGDSPDVSG